MFGSVLGPASTLAFKAAANLNFDILFDHAAARAHGGEAPADRTPEARRDLMPVIDSFAVTQDITKESMELLGPTLA